jgi:hypothetical protein
MKFRSDILSLSLKITHSVNGKMQSLHFAPGRFAVTWAAPVMRPDGRH